MQKTKKPRTLWQKLTLRYVLALSLILCVFSATFFLFNKQIKLAENDAHTINISGMQRMLSQRIALMVREIHHTRDPDELFEYVAKMQQAVNQMQLNHDKLLQLPMSRKVYNYYYAENGLNTQVKHYLALSVDFLRTYQLEGLEAVQESGLMRDITLIARNGFLKNLNAAVYMYEAESEAKIQAFRRYESIAIGIGIGLLLLEVLFIFRPMVREVAHKTTDLENRNKELLEFSYRISHDLRAPIVSAIGLTKVARNACKTGNQKQAEQSFDYIDSSLSSLQRLIDDVVTLTKMKMAVIPKEEVFVPSMLEAATKMLAHMPEVEKIDIQVESDITENYYLKRMLLQQIVENLLSNAIKYADFDKGKPFVTLKAHEQGENCVIRIIDNGIGIPADYRDKLFEMFQRFHPKVSFGSGLGLYLVWQNAYQLKGRIEYFPLPDGSEFKLTFPIQKQETP